jgi:hypothetical protein
MEKRYIAEPRSSSDALEKRFVLFAESPSSGGAIGKRYDAEPRSSGDALEKRFVLFAEPQSSCGAVERSAVEKRYDDAEPRSSGDALDKRFVAHHCSDDAETSRRCLC